MITTGNLQNQSKAELASLAKRFGIQVAGLSKDQLVKAIGKASKNGKPTKPQVKTKAAAAAATNVKSNSKTNSKTSKPTSKNPAKPIAKNGTVKKSEKVVPAKTVATKPASSKIVEAKPPKTVANKPGVLATAAKNNSKSSASKPETKETSLKSPVAAKPTLPKKAPATSVTKDSSAAIVKPAVTKAPAVKKPAVEKKKESVPATNPKVLKKIREMQLQKEANKDISYRPRLIKPPGATDPIFDKEPQKDRIALFVRDPFWLHTTWDITRGAIERAQSALSEQWYGARPVLRLIRIEDSQATSVSETVQLEIDIRGGVRNWYIPWTGESANFRVSVGYLGSNGRFHVIAQSNIVRTPASSTADAVDQHWTDLGPEGERIFAMSGGYDSERETGELQEVLEDRLNRSLGAPTLARLGAAADAMYQRRGGFHFDMDVELVVYGSTSPDAYLTLNEEPVALRPDGTFVVRLPFPDRRQVIPAVAVARDGSHQRTIVVGVERNTKIMEPMEQEQDLGE